MYQWRRPVCGVCVRRGTYRDMTQLVVTQAEADLAISDPYTLDRWIRYSGEKRIYLYYRIISIYIDVIGILSCGSNGELNVNQSKHSLAESDRA